jgi:chitinase
LFSPKILRLLSITATSFSQEIIPNYSNRVAKYLSPVTAFYRHPIYACIATLPVAIGRGESPYTKPRNIGRFGQYKVYSAKDYERNKGALIVQIRRFCLLALVTIMVTSAPLSAQNSAPQPKIVGYFASWAIYGNAPFFINEIPAEMLTHINYAFAGISPEGEIALLDPWADTQFPYPGDTDDQQLKGNFNQLRLLKEAHPHLQTLISVGGWTESHRFSDVALTEESRARFAASAVNFLTEYGFDGVDVDWEYPTGGGDPRNVERPEDRENFILLIGEMRAQLDAQEATDGHHYPLTIALGASRNAYQSLDWGRLVPLLDWINIMTYDMSGAWSRVTGFNAPLFDSTSTPPEGTSTDTAIRGALAAGIPPEKLLMGVPFYGRGWSNVSETNDGLHQPFSGVPGAQGGSFDYGDLVTTQVNNFARFWHVQARVPWLYDAGSKTMITYDDPESLTEKAEYAREHGLAGIMIWELSQDSDDAALLRTLYETLNGD